MPNDISLREYMYIGVHWSVLKIEAICTHFFPYNLVVCYPFYTGSYPASGPDLNRDNSQYKRSNNTYISPS